MQQKRQRVGLVAKAKDTHEKVVYELEKQNSDVAEKINEQDGTVKNGWSNLMEWFNENPIVRWIKTKSDGGNSFSSADIQGNAEGTDYWSGGLTWVGELGPELVNLPRGSQVIPNNKIGGVGGTVIDITVANHGTVVGSNGMNEFADIVSRKIANGYGLGTGGAF